MTSREALIEKAAKAMYSPTLWPVTNEETKSRYRAQAEIALAVFEESQKPTEDEREALSNFLFTIYEHGDAPNALQEADAILSFLAGFRRPASPEPSAVETIKAMPIESLRNELRHRREPQTEPTEQQKAWARFDNRDESSGAQAEPTDAQVTAAAKALYEVEPLGSIAGPRDWGKTGRVTRSIFEARARLVVRAAFAVKGERR